jgi:hypothetical protein
MMCFGAILVQNRGLATLTAGIYLKLKRGGLGIRFRHGWIPVIYTLCKKGFLGAFFVLLEMLQEYKI